MFNVLDNSRFSQYIREVSEDGRSGFTFIATLDIADDGGPIPCYVKAYQNGEIPRGRKVAFEMSLFNECIGYLLARESNYCVPEHAGIVSIDSDRCNGRPEWMHGNWLCFYSSMIDYPSINGAYLGVPRKNISEEIAKIGDMPAVIAFDDVAANVDRNFGNLLIGSNGGVYLIDHGRIFGRRYLYWLPEDLEDAKDQKSENILERALRSDTQIFLDDDFRRKIYVAHEDIETCLVKNNRLLDITSYLSSNSILPTEYTDAIYSFITHRSNPLEASRKHSVLNL